MKIFQDYLLAEPHWLWLLLAIPLLMFLGYQNGSRSWIQFSTLRVLGTLGWKPKDRPFRFAPLVLPLALIPAIIGLARPQEAKDRTSRTASGIDIIVALDVSGSMSAPDFYETKGTMKTAKPRITAAKKIISEFIDNRSDDRIGIVSFAARPYALAPITLDHQILISALDDAALVKDRDESGTAIGSALAAAGLRLDQIKRDGDDDKKTKKEKAKSKIIVLVTDGADNSGQLRPLEAARYVFDLGIKVYTVAIGTPQGRISASNAGREFDPETLKKIANITGGDYYRATDYTGLRSAFQSIDELEKTEVKQSTWIIRKELYPWFIGPSVLVVFGFLAFTAFNPPPMP